ILLPIVDGIHNLENIKCINSHELNNENLQDQDILSILFAFKSHHTLYDNHGDDDDDDDDGILNKVHQINNGNTLLQTTFNTKQSLKYNHLKCKQKVTIIKRLNKLFKRIKRTVLTNEHVPTAYEYVPFIKSPAKIVHAPLDTKAIAGESILFFCQAEGNPLPRVVFRWNDNEITQNRPGLQFKELSANSVALRAKLELNHNGDTVTCFAQNHVGSDSATAQISVYSANETPPRGFPKVHQDPSATISQVGDSTQLQCDVSAEPQATVYWIKDQFELIDTNLPRFRIV
ncbi:Tyrosine-protein phosphatase Lar-like, partial [Schistosoma japonicum]